MTLLEFHKKYCQFCGTQRCLGTPKEVSNCGRYHGEIPDIPKIKSMTEVLKKWEAEDKELWEEIKARYKI